MYSMIRWIIVLICLLSSLAVLSFHVKTIAWINFTDPETESTTADFQSISDIDAIQPYLHNPSYWQYNGEPVLLLGGSDQDNLFNHPDLPPDGLEVHLDLLVSAGGNYIRNTMSSRDDGNVWPFKQLGDSLYDLEQWNTEYWDRLENLLRLTGIRQIIVQIEIWDPWDIYGQEWIANPWNPENNVNYSTETSQLAGEYDPPGYADGTSYGSLHDFFLTIPDVEHNKIVLSYQARFVEKLLSHTLSYDHVLYTITNEIHPQYPPDWGWYWSRFIKEIAEKQNRDVYITEMYWQPDMKHSQHKASLEQPGIYDYFEASQNSATLDVVSHWDNLMFIHEQIQKYPRPVNHTKMYGADTGFAWTGSTKNVIEKYWRNIFAGSASARFHRPPAGIGLGTTAQNNLSSMRSLTDSLNIFKSFTLQDMISERDTGRDTGKVYITGEPGVAYAVYFPDYEVAEIKLPAASYRVSWLEVNNSRWLESEVVPNISDLKIKPPGSGGHVLLIKPVDLIDHP